MGKLLNSIKSNKTLLVNNEKIEEKHQAPNDKKPGKLFLMCIAFAER